MSGVHHNLGERAAHTSGRRDRRPPTAQETKGQPVNIACTLAGPKGGPATTGGRPNRRGGQGVWGQSPTRPPLSNTPHTLATLSFSDLGWGRPASPSGLLLDYLTACEPGTRGGRVSSPV